MTLVTKKDVKKWSIEFSRIYSAVTFLIDSITTRKTIILFVGINLNKYLLRLYYKESLFICTHYI